MTVIAAILSPAWSAAALVALLGCLAVAAAVVGAARGDDHPLARLTLEELLTGRGFADLPASPLQRAIARAAEGRPLEGILTDEQLRAHFGVTSWLAQLPRVIVLVCGVRGGKSFIAACAAIWSCLRADLGKLKLHEIPRFAILGPTVDAATATFRILLGILQASPVLAGLVEGEPTRDTVTLRRPDGRLVEICVVAASRGGATLRNRWLVGAIFEEVAQLGQEQAGHVVSAEELYSAAVTRLLEGCQLWLISSPYGPVGLLFKMFSDWFGKPGRALVVHAPTRALNPTFPQSEIDAVRAENPDVAEREHDAKFIDADNAYLGAALVDPAQRKEPLERPRPGRAVVHAGMDAGTRGNAWTVALAWADQDGEQRRVVVAAVREWKGSKSEPLSPRAVFREIAAFLEPYACHELHCDSWAFDAMQDHALEVGLSLVEKPSGEGDAAYAKFKALLGSGLCELPPHPVMRDDLIRIRQRATAGGVNIYLPLTANGRHCDFAPSVAQAVLHASTGWAAADSEALRMAAAEDVGTRSRYEPPSAVDAGGPDWFGFGDPGPGSWGNF